MTVCPEIQETWDRIADANNAAGWPSSSATWTVAERDQMEALARDFNNDVELYPVIHAWPTQSGSQLQFWCRYCKDYHVHGRHMGTAYIAAVDRSDAKNSWVPRLDAVLPLRLWKRYLEGFANCTFNDCVPGGRGLCTCPVGAGNGHRVAHCWNTASAYYRHGYFLHEVPPNDARAVRKPPSRNRTH